MTRPTDSASPHARASFEGRPLDRPHDELADQGAPFDIRTMLTRRRVLGVLGVGVAGAVLAACSTGGSNAPGGSTGASMPSTGEIPDETAGPYPGDGSNGPDVLERSGIVRRDIRSSLDGGATAEGVLMTLTLTILDMANGDIHFEVYPSIDDITDSTKAIATSQVALPEQVCTTVYARLDYPGSSRNLSQVTLANDTVFGDDGGALQLATVAGDADAGYEVALTVRVDTTTQPSGGSVPSRGGSGGPGGPGGRGPSPR